MFSNIIIGFIDGWIRAQTVKIRETDWETIKCLNSGLKVVTVRMKRK